MVPSITRVPGALLLLLLALCCTTTTTTASPGPPSCPRPCACPQLFEVHCTFRSLLAIPAAVPKHVKRMNLGFNRIGKIRDSSLAGLRKLELLLLHGNDIHDLPDGAFRDLSSLQMLKFSYNKLKEINRHTLRGLWALARLHLDHNHLEFIHPDAFHGLTSLRLLQLEGNRLQQLHPATFVTFTLLGHFHFSTLKHLYLSDNELTALPAGLVATMPQLENLHLHGNPWTCDCNMKWLQAWDKKAPGVLKCKKDKALSGGQLCPMCSSPQHVRKEELLTVRNLECSRPVINSLRGTSLPDDKSELMTLEDFADPFGNISLGLSDEHGNKVDLECSIKEPRNFTSISWEQFSELKLSVNISLSVDIECLVDRGRYEQLWRLIAYYSSIPAHLQRGPMIREKPHPSYIYKQDSEKNAQYYTGVKVDISAQPSWLMQKSVSLQLNRLRSSAKSVYLVLSTDLVETEEVELLRTQRRTWVIIESTNKTHKASSAILGVSSQIDCNVQSSSPAAIRWTLPDGTTVAVPYRSSDNRVSVSEEGQLAIKAVQHADTGVYYCVAKVEGDLAMLPFHLSVQEPSGPPLGEENASVVSVEGFTGSPISLSCITSGSPDAYIHWILPSSKTVCFQANTSRAFVFLNGTLHIPQTQLTDIGYYKCVAINQYGVDTAVTRVALVRRKVPVRPFRKLPARPQSASGVSTQIKVSTENEEEASGESEVLPRRPLEPMRRRIPAGAAADRRGAHLLRRPFWRPVVRKPIDSTLKDRRAFVDSRRKSNSSKSRIDPEKWADILARIRDRKAQTTVTPLPAQHETEGPVLNPTTHSENIVEGSSDGVTPLEEAPEEHYTTPAQTPGKPTDLDQQVQGVRVTDISKTLETEAVSQTAYRIHNTYETEGPLYHVQRITLNTNLDVRTTSNSALFLPQTTSVSPNAVTVWQANTGGSSFPQAGEPSENADTDGGVGADQSVDRGRSGSMDNDDPSDGSENTFLFSRLSVGETNGDESGKSISEAATTFQTELGATTQDSVQPQTLPSPTEASLLTGGHSRPRLRRPNGRRKNGSRRKRPNGRKQKPNKATRFMTTTPAHSLAVTERATTYLSGIKETSSIATVPLSSSQAVSLDPLIHGEGTALLLGTRGTTKLSVLTTLPESDDILPLARQPIERTTATLSLSTISAVAGGTILTSPTDMGILEALSPTGHFDKHTVAILQLPTLGSPTPGLSEESELAKEDTELLENSDDSSGDFAIVTQTLTNTQMDLSTLDSPTQTDDTALIQERDSHFSTLPSSPTFSVPLDVESTVEVPVTMLGDLLEVDVDEMQHGTEGTSEPEEAHNSPSQSNILNSESEGLKAATASWHPSTASFTPRDVNATTRVPYIVATTPAAHNMLTLFSATAVAGGHSEIQQTTLLQRTSDLSPVIQSTNQGLYPLTVHPTSPAAELISRETGQQVATPVPTVSTLQTLTPGRGPPTGSLSTNKKHEQLPRLGSAPGKKPRITKSNFQSYAARAEADVQLPCKVEGEPLPVLSWTKVASGTSVTQNTRVQRFEVDSNGTLIIRNAHPRDGGQYLCTAQNPYGVDKMIVNLVIQSQHPRIQHPRQRDLSVHEGGNLNMDCIAEGHPLPLITWVLPNHAHMTATPLGAPPRQRISVLINGTLSISEATYADRGIYKCIGSSTAGADTVLVRLQVSMSPPLIQQKPTENVTFPEGSTAYIHCTTSGTPRPVIRWITPDGIQHIPSQSPTRNNVYVLYNGTLFIRGLSPGNSGRYECLASNTVATSKRAVFVSIQRSSSTTRAKITMSSPQRTDIIYGGSLLLNCVAKGEPEPWILWRTPSKKLVDSQYSFDSRIKVSPNGTITIQSVTEKDSGDYLCSARNKMGDDYVLLRVNVLTRPAKIKHDQQQSSQEVVYGGDLKVDCVASGLPNPEISWALPDGTMVNPDKRKDGFSGGRSRRYVVFDNGTLYFNDVGIPEEGDYTCYAENKLGKDEMKVSVKVKVATSPPTILDKSQKVLRVPHGETVSLRCNARGEVVPVITWISPANRVIGSALEKYQILDDGTLIVKKVQHVDAGNYTCLAKNSAGQDQKVIRLEIHKTPPVINGLSGTFSLMKVKAVEEQRIFIDCVARGTPTPSVTWVLPGNVLLSMPYFSNRMIVHQNGTLEIRSAKLTDSGQLSCIAQNEGGEVRLLVNLEVMEAVERSQIRGPKLESLSLTVGNAMTLNCSFEGSTLPHVTWILPNGAPLRSGARFSKFYHRPDGSLIISNPSLAEAGMYRCIGRVPQGIVEHKVTLSPGRKPEINNRYHTPVSIMIGESLPLHCKTSSNPVRLTWTLPSGVVLNRPQRAGRYTVLANGTLSIQQVSIYDRGSYVCRVANEYGSSLLPVLVSVIAYPPQITSGPPSVTFTKRGVAIQLNCISSGIPRADVAWETPDKTRLVVGAQPRLYGNRYLHPQGSLIIQNPTQRDAGVYRCTARNAIGIDSRATFLNVF